jgi:hypothetical protein
MEASKALQSLKVPKLKARCKEVNMPPFCITSTDDQLRIPNFSKLSKADLIAKILEATTTAGHSTDTTTITHPTVQATPTTLDEPNGTKKASGEKSDPKKKEGNVKKRKATDQPGPSSKSSQECSAKEVDHATDSTQPQEPPPPKSVSTSLPDDSAGSADAAPSGRTKTAKTKESASVKPKAPKKTLAPTSMIESSSEPQTKTKPQVMPKPRSNPKPPLVLKSQDVAQAQTDPKAPTFWKTPTTATTSKPKARPSVLTAQVARPRFTGLVSTKPVDVPPPAPLPRDIEIDLSTFNARIKFIESHFLNTLFTLLHHYRAKPITSTYPCPPSFMKSPKYKHTSHLAFQGFHPDVYDTKDGFQVAIRFWIARLHSYMQLGSGEAWSGRAGGMGMLGPDMATWPAVIGVERVTEEVWAVRTEEELGEVRYLVMGEIGEVIASSKGITGDEVLVSGCVVRSDWAKYLGSRDRKSLESMVKTKESYYFPNGVAKGWAAKQSEGMVKIANRAVLASCALNR